VLLIISKVTQDADILPEGSVDPAYHAKAHILNQALQEIGMGRYQVRFVRRPLVNSALSDSIRLVAPAPFEGFTNKL